MNMQVKIDGQKPICILQGEKTTNNNIYLHKTQACVF